MACNITPMSGERDTIGVNPTGPDEGAPSATGAIWAVVPVKRLAAAKRRLAGALGEAREEFAYLLACRTLDVLQSADMFAGVIVVTPDPRVAAAALARGATVVDDEDSSLNQACTLGLAGAARRGASLAVLLPADLATLTAAALERLVRSYLSCADRNVGRSVSCVARRGRAPIWLWWNLTRLSSHRSVRAASRGICATQARAPMSCGSRRCRSTSIRRRISTRCGC